MRQTYQKGYISAPVRTPRGTKFVIRWRQRIAEGKWKQRAESLYVTSIKLARATLDQRMQEARNEKPAKRGLTLREFIDGYWKSYLECRNIKRSTLESYECGLRKQVLPVLGELGLTDVEPLHIEQLLKSKSKLSPKS